MARRPITGMFTNVQEMSPDEFASGVTAPIFITGSSGGDVFKELLNDIPEMSEDPEEPPRPEDVIDEAFSGWDAFIKQALKYIEDQASDDIDRVYLANEIQELQNLFSQYQAGEITKEEFLEFSRTHSSPKKPSGKRGNHRNTSPTKQSNNKNSDKQ